jgi:hypothetical protein
MTQGQKRQCLLLAGGLDAARNHPRYGHELLWWAARLDAAGFACWAALSDGTVPTLPTASIKLTSAARPDVLAGLAWLAKLTKDDLGLLVVSNHGNSSGICLWGPDVLTPPELTQALQPARGSLALVMGQCRGGVFGSLAGARTVVVTACAANESSYACPSPPGLAYDEFLYQLGTALFGSPADAPQPGPARRPLSLLDAFHWARAQDRRKENPSIFDPGSLAGGIFI